MERADYHAALIACVIANGNRAEHTPAFKPEDFLPRWGVAPDEEDEGEERFPSLADPLDDDL